MASRLQSVDKMTNNPAYQHVRLKLLSENMLGKAQKPSVIGMMSRTTNEGVSTTATGLALVTQTRAPGSVLLIDANPSEQRIADMLNCESKTLVPSNFHDPAFNLNDYLIKADDNGLPLLTLAKVDNGFTCADVDFVRCLDELKTRFETIIIDMGAWSTEAPLGWIESVDDLVLILDGNHTTREMLSHFKSTIDRCGCKLSGFIMNKHERPIPGFVYRMII